MQTESGVVFSLPQLLNIVYRGRRLIALLTVFGLILGVAYGILVKPLYRATAQVRPGIVAFTDQGAPLRGWAREDVMHFFGAALFWQHMRENPQLADLEAPPVILAEYEASALQFAAGGDVITLTNLSREPGRAVAILDAAMEAFNQQGEQDELSGDLSLTVQGLRLRMKTITNDLELVTASEERAALEITHLERELDLVGYEEKKTQLERKALAGEIAWRSRAIDATRAEADQTRQRLADAQQMLAKSLESEQNTAGGIPSGADGQDPVTEVLKQTAAREQAGRVGELLLTVNNLSNAIYESGVKADSLQSRITANEQETIRLEMYEAIVLKKMRADINQQIADKKILLTRDLVHERAALGTSLESEKVRLELVAPLERVGAITVTDKPVRPRKLRAAAILTILAFLGSIFLVLAWEYFQVNRKVILSRERP